MHSPHPRAQAKILIIVILTLAILAGASYFIITNAPFNTSSTSTDLSATELNELNESIKDAEAFIEYQKHKEADELIHTLKKKYPNDIRIDQLLIRHTLSLLKFDLAYQHAEAALKKEPNNPEIHHSAAQIMFMKKDFNAAHQHIQQALELNPAEVRFQYFDALMNLRKKNYAEAKSGYERALKLDPSHHNIYEGLAKIASIEKDYPAAIKHLEKAISLLPSDKTDNEHILRDRAKYFAPYHIVKADYTRLNGDPKEALSQLASLPESISDNHKIMQLETMAKCFEDTKDFVKAAEIWEGKFRRDKNEVAAAIRASRNYISAKKPALAVSIFREALEEKNYHPEVQAFAAELQELGLIN